MPLSIYKKLGIGEARPTIVTLQLTDQSFTHLEGKIEDILIQVDKFIFPANFIILDYEADHDVPIILGRPFLKTGRTLVDVHKGTIMLRMNDQQIEFHMNDNMKYPAVVEECSTIYKLTENPATNSWKQQQEGDSSWNNCTTQAEVEKTVRIFGSLELEGRMNSSMKLSIDDTPLNYILEELFDIWEIDFMKLFPPTSRWRVPKGHHFFDNG
ncbi:uncharacterized protein LOC111778767 [Cucurbita pepo subsp. pepo]|uniref:uncharacterized protein LOC111778767 n=1 Tax=Cucurbita pepo subsp. pepo TaxID=3664 RepID=UPI000C9D792F|nr:uncharacterized protein LOC111778767 [Cucurbita pepo subsp. pepo]